MEQFDTKLITVRSLLNTDFKESAIGKNYYIPPYQRNYAWGYEEAEKLVRDIKETLDDKEDSGYQPYFIGGVVLSEQSMSGDIRSKKSLEVIDGQQRLTTLTLIVACLIQQMKNQNRIFERKSAIQFMIDEIIPLVQTSSLNQETYSIEKNYKVERSDNLKNIYETMLDLLLNDSILDFNDLNIYITNESDKNLIKIIQSINENIELLEEEELLNYTSQILKHTYVVVTTTASTETGFLIFEKLNDSGIALEPQDLLKNYIFSTTEEEEYENITLEWDNFLKVVKGINTTKAQMQTREFLEQYLTIIGNQLKINPETKKKEKTFNKFKKVNEDYNASLDLLEDLTIIANEYRTLKRTYIATFLNTINFKLAYQVFLSFYKKFGDEYKGIQPELLILMIRLGLVYLIIGQSKELSNLIPMICHEVIDKHDKKEETLTYITGYINSYISKKESQFNEIVMNSNLFRKKPLTIMLFKILNYHFSENDLDFNIQLHHLIPQKYEDIRLCNYLEINHENYPNYINLVGNLIILDKSFIKEDIPICYKEQKEYFISKNINKITEISFRNDASNNEFIQMYNTYMNSTDTWGRDFIINRSQAIAKILTNILIFNKFNTNFLDNAIKINNQYYIKRGETINATMEIVEDGYKVYKGSRCALKEPHKNYGWHSKRNELLNKNILLKEEKYYIFSQDYIFDSPSAAASIILAKQSPGPKDWKNEFNIPLKEIL